MSLNSQELAKLRRIVSIAEKIIAQSSQPKHSGRAFAKAKRAPQRASKRTRRTGKELTRFRKMLKAERKRGVSVSELARKHGISSAYIYMLP